MMRVVFWSLVPLDLLGILLLVLGLAAAGSGRSCPASVILLLRVLPGIVLGASVVVFVRATSPGWRPAATLLAAAPALIRVSARGSRRFGFARTPTSAVS